jgi:UPF0755 protein
MPKKKNTLRLPVIPLSASVLLFLALWYVLFSSNTQFTGKSVRFSIREGETYTDVVQDLSAKNILLHDATFKWTARLIGFNKVYTGSYEIKQGMSNLEMVRLLKSGKQTPVNLIIIKCRTIPELCGLLGRQFEADSAQFKRIFSDSLVLSYYNTNPRDVIACFMPNTYDIYWNTSPERLLKRICAYHTRFWDNSRLALCDSIRLKPRQVEILASIKSPL